MTLSIWQLFWHASLLVKFIMLFLLSLSIVSWTLIFYKRRMLKRVWDQTKRFEDRFWSGIELTALYRECEARTKSSIGLSVIFHAGLREFIRLLPLGASSVDSLLQQVTRTMQTAMQREEMRLSRSVSLLATVGSVSPYIGLFGTVWGIMRAFISLGSVQQATLAMVAPGIAEALIATAVGLFAAIPAVIAYNQFTRRVQYMMDYMDCFCEELLGLLYHRLYESEAVPVTHVER